MSRETFVPQPTLMFLPQSACSFFLMTLGLTDHRVNRFEKLLLVWGGKYKSVADVPNLVSQDALERARNKARIKINIMMCVATLLGCFAMIYSGKKARDAGESVVKTNLDWHKKINEQYKKEQGQ
uniref:Uncharacterized protein n=1 Tax=Scylla olivacea TaxID=85551 RepID=A0A0P4WFB8_SCYOL